MKPVADIKAVMHGQNRLILLSCGTHNEVMGNTKHDNSFNETEELLLQPHVATPIHPLSLSFPLGQMFSSGQTFTNVHKIKDECIL